jgi:hypothetical protein
MSLPTQLHALSEVKSAMAVEPGGRLVAAEPANPAAAGGAAAIAVAVEGLAAAGSAAKLGGLATVLVKGAASSTVTAVRPDEIVQAAVDPATTTNQVERVLKEWATPGAAAPARRPTPPKPVPAQPAPGAARAQVQTFAPKGAGGSDPWAALRRALGRGQLNEAVAHQHELAAAADPSRPGSEPFEGDGFERAVRALLEGIGSALASDGVGAARILQPLTTPSQPNLSFRWLALLWSARGALKSGAIPAARAQIQEALTAARQLDIEARALSQWVAAEVLSQDGDPTRSLAWLAESRSRFEKVGDHWGMGQTWLSEARVLTSAKREPEASEAAKQAAALLADSEEPYVVLARLAVIRDDLAAADRLLKPLRTQAAERVRGLIQAIKGGHVARSDAGEFLREQEAPPSDRALRALERIAQASPRFVPAREALAWMLLRLGRYDDAGGVFRGLLSLPLPPGDRASVMLGLGCIANAQGTGGATTLRSVVAAGVPSPSPAAPADALPPLPPLPPLSTSALLSRGAQGPTSGAVFSGQLSSFALPDLLEFLRSGKRSGLLVCSSASGMGALRFRDGWISGAASPSTPGIGQILVLSRRIRPEALSQLAAAIGGDQPDPIVGERLVRDGVADPGTVRGGFERQIRSAIRELMLWTDGEFTFNREDEGPEESSELAVSLDPQGLLLNFFKEMDEASRGAASP